MKPIKLVFTVMFVIMFESLSFANAQDTTGFEGVISADKEFIQKGFYTVRQDLRRCVYPLCGGVWISSANSGNHNLTRCADGSRQEECYVASLEWKMLGFDPMLSFDGKLVLMRGKIVKKEFSNFGNLGEFIVRDAYKTVGENEKGRLYVGIGNNDIVCFTTPCFSLDEHILNRKRIIRSISGVDFGSVGASDEELSKAYKIIENGGVLLSAGMNMQVEEFAGLGITFVAKQIFLPLRPTK